MSPGGGSGIGPHSGEPQNNRVSGLGKVAETVHAPLLRDGHHSLQSPCCSEIDSSAFHVMNTWCCVVCTEQASLDDGPYWAWPGCGHPAHIRCALKVQVLCLQGPFL